MAKIRPNREELAIVRACAQRSANRKRIKIEPSIRVNVKDHRVGMNVRLISEEEDWNDTDLSHNLEWAEFRAGFEAAPGGRGLVDLAIYEIVRFNEIGDLATNVQAVFEEGRLVRVDGTGKPAMWAANR